MPASASPSAPALIRQALSLTLRNGEILLLLGLMSAILLYLSFGGRFGETVQLADQLVGFLNSLEAGQQGLSQDQQAQFEALAGPLSDRLFWPVTTLFFLTPLVMLLWQRSVLLPRFEVLSGGRAALGRRYLAILWRSLVATLALLLFAFLGAIPFLLVNAALTLFFSLVGAQALGGALSLFLFNAFLLIPIGGYYLAAASAALDRGHGVFAGIRRLVDRYRGLILALVALQLLNSLANQLILALGGLVGGWIGGGLALVAAVYFYGASLTAAALVHGRDAETGTGAGRS